jgi:hypothetical protein
LSIDGREHLTIQPVDGIASKEGTGARLSGQTKLHLISGRTAGFGLLDESTENDVPIV